MDKHIIVIGAGVIGLTTALLLKKKGYQHVTIVAKYFPGDMSIEYTSPYAGAHWRSMAPNNNKLLQKFDTDSYKIFMEIAKEKVKSGVTILDAFDYFENETLPEVKNPWYKDIVHNFKFIHQGFPKGAKAGHQYTAVVINSPVYLKWLLDEFKKLGGTTLKYHLLHIDQIAQLTKEKNIHIVNCTGLGSKYLGGVQDDALTPVRGQTVIVKAANIKKTLTFVYSSGITYVIPRSDGTVVLGGTTTKGDSNPFVDGSTAKSIIERTLSLCPELGKNEKDLDIVGHRVGLRPYRENGPRFEKQIKKLDSGKTLYITHAYGHGGFGFQASWGSAEHTIRFMENEVSKL